MKFIKVAALAAIVVSGSAMAGLIDQGGWGHGHGHTMVKAVMAQIQP